MLVIHIMYKTRESYFMKNEKHYVDINNERWNYHGS